MADEKQTVEFHMIKANNFRVIHVDGAFGGPTPMGQISAAIYSERPPIPLKIVQEVTGTGLGDEVQRSTRSGFVREVEAELRMSANTARSLAEWLNQKADAIEDLVSSAKRED